MFFRCLVMMLAQLLFQEPQPKPARRTFREREAQRMKVAAFVTGSPWNELTA